MKKTPFLSARDLTKVYSLGKVDVTALKDVSFSVEEGAFVTFSGASGSGKSTLLNLLGGLDSPTSGVIEVLGSRISEMNRAELALYRRNSVGMVFQSFNLIPARTALENIELPLVFSEIPKAVRRRRAKEFLERVGLSARGSHRPQELSGGEQQRVSIARALINEPRILLADEPTGNLDSRTSRDIVRLLADLNKNQCLTVLMVSHETALAREFSDAVIFLKDGELAGEERLR